MWVAKGSGVRSLRQGAVLASLATCVAFLALGLGLLPDPERDAVLARRDYVRLSAVVVADAYSRGDEARGAAAVRAAVENNADLRSLAARRSDGTLAAAAGDHAAGWDDPGDRPFDGRSMRVPLVVGGREWGHLEYAFAPLPRPFGVRSEYALVGFTWVAAFLLYAGFIWLQSARLAPSADAVPQRVKAALESLTEGVLVVDRGGRIALVNAAFARLTGVDAAALAHRPAAGLGWTSAGDGPPAALPWEASLRTGTPQTGVVLGLRTPTGDRRVSVNTTPIVADDGRTVGALVTLDDLTVVERKNAELEGLLRRLRRSRVKIRRQNRELQFLATRDPLTQCLNRRALMAGLQVAWDLWVRTGVPVSCVLLDVDHFKKVNDGHGHATGDEVLKGVAAVLRSTARGTDLVGRLGGEEFCVVLPQADADGAWQFAERMRRALAAGPIAGVPVTASLGVACTTFGPASVGDLLNQADQALYAAKRGGRNQVRRFDGADPPPSAPAPVVGDAAPPEDAVDLFQAEGGAKSAGRPGGSDSETPAAWAENTDWSPGDPPGSRPGVAAESGATESDRGLR